jgi:putative membrane protein
VSARPAPSTDPWASPPCGSPRRVAWIPLGIVAVLIASGAIFALLVSAGIVRGPPFPGSFPPFWFLFPLGFLVLWLVVFWVAGPWRHWGRWTGSGYGVDDAESIVRERYARGEISREEMVRMLEDLREHRTGMASRS